MARRRVLPGFGLSMGFTLSFLALVVLFPLSLVFAKSAAGGWEGFRNAVTAPRVIASLRLSFLTSLAGSVTAALVGFLAAWVLVRYRFPGRRLVDALVDLPFALPTAVAGITLTSVYAQTGWLGRPLAALGLRVAFTPLGIVVALAFIGLPFAVRTIQPVLEDLDAELEETAATLGATRAKTFVRVILPHVLPAVLTGFALAFGRALGEYGSVVFISGNMPMRTETAPFVIMTKLEQYDYSGAAAVAVVMLAASFLLLAGINRLQAWNVRSRASV